mgnify:FL=1
MSKMAIWWKRLIIAGLLLSILAIFFVVALKEEKVVLTFGMFAGNQWDVPDDDCYKIIDETIEEFEKKYPNVEIQYDSGILKDDYSEYISQKALNGELPDVFMVLPEDFNTFSSVGLLKDLDFLMEGDTGFDKKDFYAGSYDAGEFNGSQYALPYESVPTLMFVNKTLLEREGIQIPENQWTWEDFYDICQKVTKDTDGDGRIDQFGVYDYDWKDAVYSNGGRIFNQSGTECNITAESVENAILFTRRVRELSGYQNPTSNDFDTGKIAFRPMKFSEFRTYKPYPWKINKYFDFQWDCIRLPQGPDGKNETSMDHLLMGISSDTKHDQMAWEFLKMLTYNKDTQRKLFRYSQGVSPLKSVTNSEETERILREDMGEDTVVKVQLLNEVMGQAVETQKFRSYDAVLQFLDNEIDRLMEKDDNFDENILDIKGQADDMLNE